MGGAGSEGEPGGRGDRAAPPVGEAQTVELGEGLEELLGEQLLGLVALLELGADAVASVVDGVVAAPQDAIVGGAAVVAELVRRIGQTLATGPADGVELVGSERLGHQHVVPHRHDPRPDRRNQASERVGGQQHPMGPHRRMHAPHDHLAPIEHARAGPPLPIEPGHRRVVVEPHAQPQGDRSQAPHQPGGVDERDAVVGPDRAVIGGRVHLGPSGVGVEQLDPLPEPLVQLDRLGQVGHLPGCGGEGELAGALDPGVDAVAIEAREQSLEVLEPQAVELIDLVGEVAHAIGQAMGERGREEPAVATGRADADLAGLEDHHVEVGVVLLGLHRGPQPGEPSADDDEVGGGRAHQGRAGIRTPRLVEPERRGRGVAQRGRDVGAHATAPALMRSRPRRAGPRRWRTRRGRGRRPR